MPISRRPFAAVVIALLAACNSASEPSPTAAGDYVLQTIDGHRLPATGGADFVVSSSISLHSDGQFTFARIDSFPSRSGSPKDTIALSGTWSVSGADIHIAIPEKFRVGHEAHFGQVTNRFFEYVTSPGSLPRWETPYMLAKYAVSTKGVEKGKQ